MNIKKIYDYELTAGIHTLQIQTTAADPPQELQDSGVVHHVYESNGLTTLRVNPNKLTGDVWSYSEFKEVMDSITEQSGIGAYMTNRVDLKLDSFDPEHYGQYMKLHRYLIILLSMAYPTNNVYETKDIIKKDTLSMAIKHRWFEVESYNKNRESAGRDPAMARFEMRSRGGNLQNIESEFREHWAERWSRALTMQNTAAAICNDALVEMYHTPPVDGKVAYLSLTAFIMANRSTIFTRKQLVNLYERLGSANPERAAKHFKERYGCEFISNKDLRAAVAEIKRSMGVFFTQQ